MEPTDYAAVSAAIRFSNVPLETCEHAGNFSSNDPGCLVCETHLKCEWLYTNDESAALTEQPFDFVLDALGTAVLYVDACVTRASHNVRACHCEACNWLVRHGCRQPGAAHLASR